MVQMTTFDFHKKTKFLELRLRDTRRYRDEKCYCIYIRLAAPTSTSGGGDGRRRAALLAICTIEAGAGPRRRPSAPPPLRLEDACRYANLATKGRRWI